MELKLPDGHSDVPVRDELPEPGEGFDWIDEAWGPALACRPLAALARHCFSTRALALPSGEQPRGAWRDLAATVGVALEQVCLVRQVHGIAAAVVRRDGPTPTPGSAPVADIIATDDPHRAVAVRVADCAPVLLADPRSGAVAAAHIGWRGLARGAPAAAVRTLVDAFGARPADLVVAVGPAIGPCCYEVGAELVDLFRAAGHGEATLARWFVRRDGRLWLDLRTAVCEGLQAAGVLPRRLFATVLCTATHRSLFYSYRREGRAAGRLAGIIRAAPR